VGEAFDEEKQLLVPMGSPPPWSENFAEVIRDVLPVG
jgi:hypothetical protein